MYAPNILITNYCNQNCSFCFAHQEMYNSFIGREMELKDFENLLLKVKRADKGIDTIKLLGGEPTLHSHFDKIVRFSLDHFPFVQIFTNGIISADKANYLSQYFPRVKFTVNVMTPGFQLNRKIRNIVIQHLREFCGKTEVTLALTIVPFTPINKLVSLLPLEIIKKVKCFRISIANPIAGEKNFYDIKDFPKIGDILYRLIKNIKDSESPAEISLNCGFTRCMFNPIQYNYLIKNKVGILGWTCFGKGSSMDIATNLTSFHCFPLSTKYRLPFHANNFLQLNAKLLLKRYEYWQTVYFHICSKCPFYGHETGKCPGPCIAFRINELT